MVLKRPLEEVQEAHTPLVIELQTFRYVDFIDRLMIRGGAKAIGQAAAIQ